MLVPLKVWTVSDPLIHVLMTSSPGAYTSTHGPVLENELMTSALLVDPTATAFPPVPDAPDPPVEEGAELQAF